MASQLQLRRGTTAQHGPFIGAPGEVTVNTDTKTVVVHDGTTAGGFPLSRDNLNVRNFGVIGDGVTDDTVAFTNALRAFFNGGQLHLDLNGLNIAISSNIVIRFGTDGFNNVTSLGRRIHNGRLLWIGASNAGTMLDIGTNISVVADAALRSFTFENVQFNAGTNSKNLVRVFNFYVLTFASCQFLNFNNGVAVFLPSNDDSNNYTDDNGACFYDCRWACLPSGSNFTGTPILAYCGDLVVSRGFAEWCGPFDFHIGHILIEGFHWSFGNVSVEMRLAAIFRDPRQIQVLNCDNDNCGLLFTTAGFAANTTQGAATNIRNIVVSGNKYGVKDVPAGNGVITFEFTNAGTSLRNSYIGGNGCDAVGVAAPVSFLRVKTSGSGTLNLASGFYQFVEAFDVIAGDKDFGAAALGASDFTTYIGTDNLIIRNVDTNKLKTADGAVGLPSITFTGDVNTGIFHPATDTIAFATNGVEKMRIDAGGVETTSNFSGNRLIAGEGTAIAPSITFTGDGDTGIFHPTPNTMAFAANGVEKMRIEASGAETTGNFTGNRLVAGDGTAIAPSITFTGDGNTGIFHPLEATIAFCENGVEVMRINDLGDFMVNTVVPVNATTGTADGFTVLNNGQTHLSRNNSISLFLRRRLVDGRVAEFYRDTTAVGGISVTATAASFNTSSDYRLKENCAPLTGGLATVGQLSPCEFTWKSDGSIGRGFIAHELQAVVPEAVSGEKDVVDENGRPQYQGVDAAKLVPYLVAAVQELSAKVAALEARE